MGRARQRLVMLAHVLAVLLGFSSVIFYIAAFFYPEVHRRSDIVWSGLGVFYALVLWFCAGQMTITGLLGQVISVVLLLGLGWQTLTVRREKTPIYQQTPIVLTPEVVGSWTKNKINQLRIAPDDTLRPLPTQNRSLSATAAERFRQDTDPRRRPIYDYEFVEDGLAELEVQSTKSLSDLDASDIVPPSAEAEVLEEILPQSSAETIEAEILEEIASQVPQTLEAAPVAEPEILAEESQIESELQTSAVISQTEPAKTTPLSSPASKAEADDWGFESNGDWQDEENQNPSSKADRIQNEDSDGLTTRQKPSLIATPIILLGWVKDVIGSMTKPKPSKPVIEIPRRDTQPPTASANQTPPSQTPISKGTSEPIADTEPIADARPITDTESTAEPFDLDQPPALDNSDNFDDNNDWKDSNWDD